MTAVAHDTLPPVTQRSISAQLACTALSAARERRINEANIVGPI